MHPPRSRPLAHRLKHLMRRLDSVRAGYEMLWREGTLAVPRDRTCTREIPIAPNLAALAPPAVARTCRAPATIAARVVTLVSTLVLRRALHVPVRVTPAIRAGRSR
jgi:hypothetical protein